MGPKQIVRLVAGVLVAVGAILGSASAANGGGALLETTEESYAPGEQVTAWTSVAWEFNADLGTPADGPYEAYLLPLDLDGVRLLAEGPWPSIPDEALPVGQLTVSLEPYVDEHGDQYGPHTAGLEFELPELPDGRYEIVHCNEPCTTTLGDITSGLVEVQGSAAPAFSEVPWGEQVAGLRVAERFADDETGAKVPSSDEVRFAGGVPPEPRTALPGLAVAVLAVAVVAGTWFAVRSHRRSLD
jgi:hypothetical protein